MRSSVPPDHAALAASPLFGRLAPEDRALLVAQLEVCSFAPGEVVVAEGAKDRDLYVVVDGEARVLHQGVELGRVHAGDHVGELGLVAGRPRAATIRAASELTAVRLSREAFEGLAERAPAFVLRFTEALFDLMGDRLTEMDQSVGALLKARSLPPKTRLRVHLGSGDREVRAGTAVGTLLPDEVGGSPVVAALVDRRAVSLTSLVSGDCGVAPLTLDHWEGERIFLRSLGLLLLEAAERAAPEARLRVVQSLGFAPRAVADVDAEALPALAEALEREMEALAAADLPLRELWRTPEEARTEFEARGWSDATDLLRTWRQATVPLVSYGDAYALATGVCLPRTGLLRGARVVADGDGLLVLHPRRHGVNGVETEDVAGEDAEAADAHLETARVASRHVRRMTRGRDAWLRGLGITSVGAFNRTIVEGSVPRLVRVAEGFQEKRLAAIADAIAAQRDRVRVVCIAGPSSSGKTTFIKRLVVQLQVNGMQPHPLSLDDYYVDRERTPRDAAGEYDFEAFDALDVELLQRDLRALLAGEEVATARFDFPTGRSLPGAGPTLRLRDGHVLLLEGIHGLNPHLLDTLPQAEIFRVFLSPIGALPFDRIGRIHVSDLRLLRRIVRDRHGRATPAAETIQRWPSVRRGERAHIYPHQHHADAVFDSALVYELSVLKVFAERYLFEVPTEHPAQTTAFRLLRLLERFVAIQPDHVPPTSIIREFIGGSGFEY